MECGFVNLFLQRKQGEWVGLPGGATQGWEGHLALALGARFSKCDGKMPLNNPGGFSRGLCLVLLGQSERTLGRLEEKGCCFLRGCELRLCELI